jgi:cell division protein FtsX
MSTKAKFTAALVAFLSALAPVAWLYFSFWLLRDFNPREVWWHFPTLIVLFFVLAFIIFCACFVLGAVLKGVKDGFEKGGKIDSRPRF